MNISVGQTDPFKALPLPVQGVIGDPGVAVMLDTREAAAAIKPLAGIPGYDLLKSSAGRTGLT